jgi:hypothetical protein
MLTKVCLGWDVVDDRVSKELGDVFGGVAEK